MAAPTIVVPEWLSLLLCWPSSAGSLRSRRRHWRRGRPTSRYGLWVERLWPAGDCTAGSWPLPRPPRTHTPTSPAARPPACPQEIDNQIADMQRDEAPEWALDLMRWTRRLSSEVVDTNVQRYTALVDRRQAFVSGLRELERELEQQPPAILPDETAADWIALAGYNWAQQVCAV